MKISGREAAKEILECMGISFKNVRNVRIVMQAHLDEAAIATIEIDRLMEDDEVAMLATIAEACKPDIVQKVEPPIVDDNGIADVSAIDDDYKRFKRIGGLPWPSKDSK